MKLPNQAQPIARGISTAKIIGAKGIGQSNCHNCMERCRDQRGGSPRSRIICLGTCAAICALEGLGGLGMGTIFDHA